MDRLIFNQEIFLSYEYDSEEEFEKQIIEHAIDIFGPNSLYIDIKKRIGKDNIVTIPDGYLIDFTFDNDPKLYIIENELSTHDPYRHIGQQLLRFAISYKQSGRRIKEYLLDHILNDLSRKNFIEKQVERIGARNIDALLEHIIFEKSVACIVVIDEIGPELENVLGQLTMKTDIIEFQTYIHGTKQIHKFTPFQQYISDEFSESSKNIYLEELDTIIVPAHEEGFQEVFLNENCWWSIRISAAMVDRIKYIAAYQVAPISAITHYAEVSTIEKYQNSNKYIVYFKEQAKNIGPIKLPNNKDSRTFAPRSPRYTSSKKLFEAKDMKEVF